MKKVFTAFVFMLAVMTAFAQDLGQFTFDGFVRTGFLWKKSEEIGKDPATEVRLQSLDDAGNGHGRIRMNFGYINGSAGLKGRIQWDDWTNEFKSPQWPYLFGYINSFENQFTLSVGKLGASPWGTGGPEMWKELENLSSGGGGVRFEFKPNLVPGLNVGFILNWYDGSMDRGIGRDVTLLDILEETVLGFSYEHDLFLVRFEYRLDSDIDQRPGSFASGNEGTDFIYRVEERALKKLLPGLQVWAIGSLEGIGADDVQCVRAVNWLFTQYAPDWGTAQIRLGYNVVATRSILHFKPSYYHKFHILSSAIEAGASFYIANDFGDDRINMNAPYTEMEFEPKIQINFANAYVAFTYNFRQIYKQPQPKVDPPIERFQTMNLRFGMTF